MANKKITELTDATLPLNDADLVEVVQGGVNKKAPKSAFSSGGGTWGSITGTLTDQTDLNTALGLKAPLASPTFTGTPVVPGYQQLVNSANALTDGAAVTISLIKHTLTSTQGSITFTISYTGDQSWTKIILNAASATWTFPSGALCVVEGVPTGDNNAPVSGISGDSYLVNTFLFGSVYLVFVKNCGQ